MSSFAINPASTLQHLIDARRHNPCDACRLRRRKCDYVVPICGRCKKMGKKCVYLRNLTPGDQAYEQSFQSTNEIDLQPEEVLEIYRQLDVMENEIAALRKTGRFPPVPKAVEIKIERELSPSDSDTTTDSTCSTSLTDPSVIDSPMSETVSVKDENLDIIKTNDQSLPIAPLFSSDRSSFISTLDAVSNSADMLVHTFGWRLTFSRSAIQINTTIRSFHDLHNFATAGLRAALTAESLRPPPTILGPESSMVFTRNKVMHNFMDQLSHVLKTGFKNDSHTSSPSTKYQSDSLTRIPSPTMDAALFVASITKTTIDNVLEVYLACSYSSFPVIHPNVLSQLYKEDNPLASPAICIITACALNMTCSHIKRNSIVASLRSRDLARIMFERTRQILDDSMFDEPDLTNFIAVSFSSQFSISVLLLKKSWHFRGLAYRMGNLMIHTRYRAMTHLPPDRHRPPPPPVSLEEWETFKRAHWITTAIEIGLNNLHIYDPRIPSGTLSHMITEIGVPTPLPDEISHSRRAVLAIAHLLSSSRIHMPVKQTDQSTLRDILEAESNLRSWYESLPEDLRMPTYATATDDDIERFRSTQFDQITSHVALQYHCMVICIHEHFLPEDPAEVVTSPAVIRSREVCTRCAEIMTAVLENFVQNPPCLLYMPSILKSCDVHYRNMQSADPVVARRGRLGMKVNLHVARSTLFKPSKMEVSNDFIKMLEMRMNEMLKKLRIDC